MANDDVRQQVEDLRQRLDRVESLLGLAGTMPTPGFDPAQFQRILMGYLSGVFLLFLPLYLLPALIVPLQGLAVQDTLFGLPLFNAGQGPKVLGLPYGVVALGGGAVGIVAVGGLAVGGLAIGGGAVGLVAVGGGAFGVIALGGGAVGVVALGGGAVGYVAVGGGAFGSYVLAGDGRGRHVFDRRRQDPEAVRFFCRFLPRLRQAFTEETAAALLDTREQ